LIGPTGFAKSGPAVVFLDVIFLSVCFSLKEMRNPVSLLLVVACTLLGVAGVVAGCSLLTFGDFADQGPADATYAEAFERFWSSGETVWIPLGASAGASVGFGLAAFAALGSRPSAGEK